LESKLRTIKEGGALHKGKEEEMWIENRKVVSPPEVKMGLTLRHRRKGDQFWNTWS